MITFLASLRHPENSENYGEVLRLLRETLESVSNQDCEDFRIIVVGNETPTFQLPRRTRFIEVAFSPPRPVRGSQPGLSSFVIDKGTKVGVGLVAAMEEPPDQIMIFDADDFISSRVASFTASQDPYTGWFVEQGWKYSAARGAKQPLSNFNRICGTSIIAPFSAFEVPAGLHLGSSQADVIEAFGDRLTRIMGAHRNAVEWYAERGYTMRPLPFRAAVYNVDTGENHSGMEMSGPGIPVGRAFMREFGLSHRPGAYERIMGSFGPVALLSGVARAYAALTPEARG